MSEKKKKPAGRQMPEHVVRSGEVTAAIYRRQSTSGYAFLAFEVQREWTSASTNRVFHGGNFFDRHEQDLVKVIGEAAAWIRDQSSRAASSGVPPEEDGTAEQEGRLLQTEGFDNE